MNPQINDKISQINTYTKGFGDVGVATYDDAEDGGSDHFVASALLLPLDLFTGGEVARRGFQQAVRAFLNDFDLFAAQQRLSQIFLHLFVQRLQAIH